MAIASTSARLTAGLSDALVLSRQLHQGLTGCRRRLHGAARRELVEADLREPQELAQKLLNGLHGAAILAGLLVAATSLGREDGPGLETLDIALRLATDSAAAAAAASAAAAHTLSYKAANGRCEAATMCDRFLHTSSCETATVIDQLELAIGAVPGVMSGRPRLRLAQ